MSACQRCGGRLRPGHVGQCAPTCSAAADAWADEDQARRDAEAERREPARRLVRWARALAATSPAGRRLLAEVQAAGRDGLDVRGARRRRTAAALEWSVLLAREHGQSTVWRLAPWCLEPAAELPAASGPRARAAGAAAADRALAALVRA